MSNPNRLTIEEPDTIYYVSASLRNLSTKNDGNSIDNEETNREEEYTLLYSNNNLSEPLLSSLENESSKEEVNPWSLSYIGIPFQYFSVGIVYAGSVSILYPILVIQNGVTSSFYTASYNLVTLFWSYKIIFGFMSDCFPIFGYKKKSYIILGWVGCAIILFALSSFGSDINPTQLVLVLTFVNLCYVMADVAADGFMVWIAHREPTEKRGKVQTLVYTVREVGRIFVNVIILFSFSSAEYNCPGYEEDDDVECTDDEDIKDRNDLSDDYPDTWCHMKCDDATFDFSLTLSQYLCVIAGLILVSIPFYLLLNEQKSQRENPKTKLAAFWLTLQRKAIYQIMLYSIISNITFNVYNPAKIQANHLWLHLTTVQNQILNIMECIIFFVGLGLIRKYALNYSWRKLIWAGSVVVTVLNLLYLFIVYDVIRNPWFYMFTDVSATFIYTLNYMASGFCIVEVAEPGYEAVTYALITTSGNAVTPLSSVISYQSMALFPKLNTQDEIEEDTPTVRNQFAALLLITLAINLSSLLCLPMLPRQKKETRELVQKGESSLFWARFTVISVAVFLLYSTTVTFFTVAGADKYGCYKVFGGEGCTEDESSVPVFVLITVIFVYCYGVNFYHTFWPIVKGDVAFDLSVFF